MPKTNGNSLCQTVRLNSTYISVLACHKVLSSDQQCGNFEEGVTRLGGGAGVRGGGRREFARKKEKALVLKVGGGGEEMSGWGEGGTVLAGFQF